MPKNFDFNAETEALFKMKKVNLYMAKYLLGLGKAGLNEELWDEAIDDAVLASKLGVKTEDDFAIFFYIDHFVEDLAAEIFGIKLEEEDEDKLKEYMFSIREEVDYGNLLTYRVALLKWLQKEKKFSKESHPNSGKAYSALPKYNHARWYKLLEQVKSSLSFGVDENVAVFKASKELGSPENLDFLAWYQFYRRGEQNKYDVNMQIKNYERQQRGVEMKYKMATSMSYVPSGIRRKEERQPAQAVFNPAREQMAQDFDSARTKLISRTFSIDKLLERYRKALDSDQIDAVEDALNLLRKKIRKLRLAATVRDSMIKTANICSRYNFQVGAEQLLALAQDKEDIVDAPSIKEDDTNTAYEEGLAKVLDQLGYISHQLKNRNLVRSMAEADLLMNELGISSFFPELTDAQAKLIEGYGYASNKIDDMLPKVRGGLFKSQEDKEEIEPGSPKGSLDTQVSELAKNITEPEAPKSTQKTAPRAGLEVNPVVEGPVAEAPVPTK